MPETLHALIAARLDGVSGEERRLLQDGAVLGKTFTVRALAALAGRPADELEPLLSGLVRKEVLGVQSDPRSPERGQYGFLQDPSATSPTRHSPSASASPGTWPPPSTCIPYSPIEDEIAEVLASHYLAVPPTQVVNG